MAKLGELLRRARQARGWSQTELGRRVGGHNTLALTRSAISKYENGARPITETMLGEFDHIFGEEWCRGDLADQAEEVSGHRRVHGRLVATKHLI